MHLHCAYRTKFLTAEASDTQRSIYFRLAVFYNDSLGGAYSSALVATDAKLTLKLGP